MSRVNDFLVVLFFLSSIYLFSSVSVISKLFLFVILFFLVLNNFYAFKISKKNLDVDSNHKLFFIFLFFLAYIVINTFFISKIPFESKFGFLNFIIYFVSFHIFSVIKSKLDKNLQIVFFLVLFSFICLYLIFGEKVIYFFVYNPNVFSGYCLFTFLFSLFSFKKNPKLNLLLILNFFFSLTFLIVLKSFSSLIIALFFLSFVFVKKRFYILVFSILCLAVTVVLNFSSFFDRLVWLLIGMRVWLDNLFFGVGLENFKFFYQQYSIGLPFTSTATVFVHNYFLNILIELGTIGGIFLCLILFFSFFKGISKEDTYLYPVLGILIQNLIDYNLIIPQNGILFFSFLGLISKEQIQSKQSFKPIFMFKNLLVIFLIVYGFYNSFILLKVTNLLRQNNFAKVIKMDKSCWYAYKKIALEKFSFGDLENAREYFLKAINFNPVDAENYLYLSIIDFKMQRKKQGYENFKKAIKFNPKASRRYKEIIDREIK